MMGEEKGSIHNKRESRKGLWSAYMRKRDLKFCLIIGISLIFNFQIMVYAEEGVTENLIKVGSHMDLSGPLAHWGIDVSKGIQCYLNRVNEQGGIFGRKIVILVEDDQSQPSRAREAVKRLLEVEHVFSILSPMGTVSSLSSMPLAREEGVPFLFPLSGHDAFFKPVKRYVFSLFTPYSAEARIGIDFLVQNLSARKIGILYQDDGFGGMIRRRIRSQLKKHDLSLVSEVPLLKGSSDLSPEIRRLKNDGIEALVLATVSRKGTLAIKTIRKAGWDVIVLGMRPIDPLSLIGMTKSNADGIYVSQQQWWIDSKKPGVLEFRKDFQKSFPGEPIPAQSMEGYRAAKIFVEALKRAGRKLSRDRIIMALETMRSFDDGVGPPVSFSNRNHLGSRSLYILQIRGGKGVAVTGFRKPIK